MIAFNKCHLLAATLIFLRRRRHSRKNAAATLLNKNIRAWIRITNLYRKISGAFVSPEIWPRITLLSSWRQYIPSFKLVNETLFWKSLNIWNSEDFQLLIIDARRVIENTFGILVARWRVFQKPIDAKPERVEKIILAAIALHNYLRKTDNACYTPNGFVDSEDNSGNIVPGQWRSILDGNSLQNVRPIRNQKYTRTAIETREALANYLATDGSVSWQLDYIRRTGNE